MIEQEFFKAFGIGMQHALDIKTNQFVDFYPEITAEILLKLLCIYSKDFVWKIQNQKSIEMLKENILSSLIECSKIDTLKQIKAQVQALFGEE